jgi:hypothetical protein
MLRRLKVPSLPTAISLLALSIAVTGTAAAATTGQLVNIVDSVNGSSVARVVDGRLRVSATGTVAATTPRSPFTFAALSFEAGVPAGQMDATAATLALTGIHVANATANYTSVKLYQVPGSGSACPNSVSGGRFLAEYAVPSHQSFDSAPGTPMVLRPMSSGATWCLVTVGSGNTGDGLYITFTGYVPSGTFTAPSAAPVTRTSQQHRVTRGSAR